MHGLGYIHGDLKSVRVSSGLISYIVDEFCSLMFLLTATTLPALPILDQRLFPRYRGLTQVRFQPLWDAVPSRYGGSLQSSLIRRDPG